MIDSVKLLKLLGVKTRYLIVKTLLSGEMCACEIPSIIKRTQSNTSMHLAKFVEAEMLKQRRDGKCIFYSIKDKRIIKILKIMEEK